MAETIEVMIQNIMHGRGPPALKSPILPRKTVKNNLDAIASKILSERPEVVLFQEIDFDCIHTGGFNHLTYLQERTGYNHACPGLHVNLPGFLSYGTAIMSQYPIENPYSRILRTRTPILQKGYVAATIPLFRSGSLFDIDVVSVHLAYIDMRPRKLRKQQAKFLIEALKARPQQNPLILGGDFNCDPRNAEQTKSAEQTLHYIADELDLTIPLGGEGANNYSYPPGTSRDWILASKDFTFESFYFLPQKDSDHRAVVAKLKRSRTVT